LLFINIKFILLYVNRGFKEIEGEDMKKITDQLLIESYFKAIELDLDKDFILVLEEELKRRGLSLIVRKDRH
jgi:developmental checkpoint coupling sporulation initiation to replication initiation